MRLVGVVAGVLLVVLLALGCGGSSDGTTAAAPITKKEFVKKATSICEKASQAYVQVAYASLSKEVKKQPDVPQNELEYRVVGQLYAPTFRKELDEIRALGMPEGDEEEIEAILGSIEQGLKEAEEDPQRFSEDLAKFGRPFERAVKLAKAYGIEACGQP